MRPIKCAWQPVHYRPLFRRGPDLGGAQQYSPLGVVIAQAPRGPMYRAKCVNICETIAGIVMQACLTRHRRSTGRAAKRRGLQVTHATSVYVVSDIHTDYAVNLEWVARLRDGEYRCAPLCGHTYLWPGWVKARRQG
jgi:hypothetical protein